MGRGGYGASYFNALVVETWRQHGVSWGERYNRQRIYVVREKPVILFNSLYSPTSLVNIFSFPVPPAFADRELSRFASSVLTFISWVYFVKKGAINVTALETLQSIASWYQRWAKTHKPAADASYCTAYNNNPSLILGDNWPEGSLVFWQLSSMQLINICYTKKIVCN